MVLLQAWIWDLLFQLPNCKFVIIIIVCLGHNKSRFYWFWALWVKELKVSCCYSDFHGCSCVFSFPEICLHWTLWENGTGAQVSPVADLHWREHRDDRTVPSACPHATLYPSKWVFSGNTLPAAPGLWALVLLSAQVKAEFSHLNGDCSDVSNIQWLIIQMHEGCRATASFLFLPGPRSYRRPGLKGSVFLDRSWQ